MLTMKSAYPEESEIKYIPERRLLAAILELAIRDLNITGRRRLAAIEWFRGAPGRFTFQYVDDILSLSAARKAKIEEYINNS